MSLPNVLIRKRVSCNKSVKLTFLGGVSGCWASTDRLMVNFRSLPYVVGGGTHVGNSSMSLHTRTHTYTHVHTHTHTHVHTHIHTHTHAHARTHTHTHTHMAEQCQVKP